MELGCALEHAIAERYEQDEPGRYLAIGELALDGVTGTPDLVDLVDNAVIEIKLTWSSGSLERNPPDSQKFWRYWVQLMSYCKMYGTNTGRLHVCHINGDYAENRFPIYRVWERKFTDEELATNWRMILTNAEKESQK